MGSCQQAQNYKKFAETFLQRSTDNTKEKKENSSIFDSVPSIDLNLSKDELQVLKRQLGQCNTVYSNEDISLSLDQHKGGSSTDNAVQ